MRSFENFMEIYSISPFLNNLILDKFYDRYDCSFSYTLMQFINYFKDVSNEQDGDITMIYQEEPEIYAFVMWCKIYQGHLINIYETDFMNVVKDMDTFDLPRYMEELFSDDKKSFEAYLAMCAVYAMSCGNVTVLAQALLREDVSKLLLRNIEVKTDKFINLILDANPSDDFLRFAKQKIFKNIGVAPSYIKKEHQEYIPLLIDLGFEFKLNNVSFFDTVKPKYWPYLFGLRDFPLFNDRLMYAARIYHKAVGGSDEDFNELLKYWRDFYQTPERKIEILDLEKTIRGVKKELNDLMYAYNDMLELNPEGNLALREIKHVIEETKLRLDKLETQLNDI